MVQMDVRALADEDLIPLMARGEARAFEAVYERHSGAAKLRRRVDRGSRLGQRHGCTSASEQFRGSDAAARGIALATASRFPRHSFNDHGIW